MKMKLQIAAVIVALAGGIIFIARNTESEKPASLTRFPLTEFYGQRQKYINQYILLMGFVEDGSIQLKGDGAKFNLKHDKVSIPVYYNGQDGIPDTFKDGAQALLEGKWTSDNLFYAHKITTKCASKYNQEGM